MSSPKFIRSYKSPRNVSNKNLDPKIVQKKTQKSKQPFDRERRHKQQLQHKFEQISQKNKQLTSQLNKQKLKNQALEKQLKVVLQQLKKMKQQKNQKERNQTLEKHTSVRQNNIKSSIVRQDDKGTQKKQQRYFGSQETISAFQPQSPRQKLQVGGYFGSLFN